MLIYFQVLLKVDLKSNQLRVCYQGIRIFFKTSLLNFRKAKKSLYLRLKYQGFTKTVYRFMSRQNHDRHSVLGSLSVVRIQALMWILLILYTTLSFTSWVISSSLRSPPEPSFLIWKVFCYKCIWNPQQRIYTFLCSVIYLPTCLFIRICFIWRPKLIPGFDALKCW